MHNVTKTNLMFFVVMTLSTGSIVAMEPHQITVINLLPDNIETTLMQYLDSDYTTHTIESQASPTFIIQRQKDNIARLALFFHDYNTPAFLFHLKKEQKHITVRKHPQISNKIIIEDETKQLASTFTEQNNLAVPTSKIFTQNDEK
jgi:hypothetical protein